MTLQDLKDNRIEILEMITEYTNQFEIKADLKTVMQVIAMNVEFTKATDLRDFISFEVYNMRHLKTTLHQKLYSK